MWTITLNCSLNIADPVLGAGSALFHGSGLALQVAGEKDFKFGQEIGSRLKFLARPKAAKEV